MPVDMMQARTYPLRWFLLEQPEIQVTFDHPPRLGLTAGRRGGKEGAGLWSRLRGRGGCGPSSLQSCR